ncbi:acyltransferase family protein [Mycolicibacterium thermoresistibile]
MEGLRAVAVIAVVLFHAGLPGLGGGFIGVDVFFVISGFLITGLLWREAANTGTVQLARFYGARARRLLPAAATVLIATVVFSVLLLPPLQARSVIGDGIASALYVGNYRFAIEGTDYLSTTQPSPLQHYWSLGVEEQFYLLWPALILATVWLLGRTTRLAGVAAMRSATPYVVVLAGIGVASFLVSMTLTASSPSWAFFGLPSRAWELAVGGLVALTIPWWRRLPPVSAAVAGWGGLTLIVLTCAQVNDTTPFPGTAALLPVFGTALVIIAGCATPNLGAGRFLGKPMMRSIGRVSYSWYLWHWPVLILAPAVLGRELSLAGNLAMVGVSLGLAILTLHLIENPARFAHALQSSAVRSLAVGAVATATAVCAALVLLAIRPVPVGAGEAPAPAAAAAPVEPAEPEESEPLSGRQQIQAAVAASAQARAVPANLTPSLAQAPNAKPEMFVNGCVRSWRDVDQPECVSGDVRSPVTVALFGDSHAGMWESALNPVAQQRHWRLETMGKVTCPPQELPIVSPYLGRTFTECGQWRTQVLNRLKQDPPQLVIVDMVRRYGADFGFTSYDRAWLRGLTELVSTLRGYGSQVLVLGPVPDPHGMVPNCLSANMDNALACAPARHVGMNGDGIAAEAAATVDGGGVYADLTDLFCTADHCPVVVGDTLVFRDDNHITSEYAAVLAPVLGEVVAQALAPALTPAGAPK